MFAEPELGYQDAHGFPLRHVHHRSLAHSNAWRLLLTFARRSFIADSPASGRPRSASTLRSLLPALAAACPPILPCGTHHCPWTNGGQGSFLAPSVKRCPVDAMTTADLVGLCSGYVLLQHADDLLFAESFPLHGSSSFIQSKVENSKSQWPGYWGEGRLQLSCWVQTGNPATYLCNMYNRPLHKR